MDRLILFTSYYFATKSETYLKENGVNIQMIATPPQLSDACGLCLLLAKEDLPRVLELFKEGHISHSGIFTYGGKQGVCEKIKV